MNVFKKAFVTLLFLMWGVSSFAITVSPEYIDFGRVKKYTSKKRYISIKNDAKENIEIIGIVNACGIALKIEKKELLPGETIEGELFFDSGLPQGTFEEKVTIVYKEKGEIKEKKIKVTWYNYPEKYPELILKEKSIELGNILPKMPHSFEFEIMNAGNMVLTVTSPVQDGFLLNLPVDIMPGETKKVKGTFVVENIEKGERFLQLETNDLSNPRVNLPVRYNASWDHIRGTFVTIEGVYKTEDGYDVVLKINSKDSLFPVEFVDIEDIDGKKVDIKLEERKLLNKREEQNIYILKLSEEAYRKFEKSYLYIKLGISH